MLKTAYNRSSTLENWGREFERFSPQIVVETYYGSQNDRIHLRSGLLASSDWEVLLTTYNLAQGSDRDRAFLRKIGWNVRYPLASDPRYNSRTRHLQVCIFDEGHILKNFQSQRYTQLARLNAEWKVLLTGTPLQNDLQELVVSLHSLFME